MACRIHITVTVTVTEQSSTNTASSIKGLQTPLS